jgi:[acyl-carrier-protein] S-malonyltransferase
MIVCWREEINLPEGTATYAILFPGQLSEKAGMGAPFRFHPIYKGLASSFGQLTGGRFERWVLEAGQEEISERFTAPGIVVLFDLLASEAAVYEWGPPVAVAGYSLGFYAAAVLSKCVPVSAVLTWLEKVNASNARSCPAGRYALAASTGLSEHEVTALFSEWQLGGLRVANVNNPRQLVFAGPSAEVADAVGRLAGRVLDVRILPLDVPLHTSYMEPACLEVQSWWSTVPTGAPVLPLLSPVDGRTVGSGAAFKKEMLASLQTPTRWDLVIEALAKFKPDRVLDLSPDGSLGRMARWTNRDLSVVPVSALWDRSCP